MVRLLVVSVAAVGIILLVAYVISRLALSRTRGMSIRLQVFLALALTIGAFALGLGVMVLDRVEARASRLATQAAEDEAKAISMLIAADLERTGVSLGTVAERFSIERRRGVEVPLELLDGAGRQLFPDDEPGSDSADGAGATAVAEAPITVNQVRVGSVRVAKPTVVMRRLLADLAPVVLVISLVLGAAAAVASLWIGRAIARPIERLTEFSERVSQGERTAAPPTVPGREVNQLSRSIDSMRRQLEGRPFVETFAADLSHELKNPVAAIRASAEVLAEGALDEPLEARRFVARIREATERIERLLGELLDLARIEARGTEDRESIDLAALVARVVAGSSQPERVEQRVHGDTTVRGDGPWLSRAFGNLLQNALLHSPPGSAVRVDVRRGHGAVELDVANSGSIPARDVKRIFGRFVTTRADRGGTGLGLSIVRAVAEAHGGGVILLEPGPPTVTFRMALPPRRRTARERLTGSSVGSGGEAREG